MEGLGQLLSTIQHIQQGVSPNLKVAGLLLTMYDSRVKLSHQVEQEVRAYFGDLVFNTIIPRNIRLGEAPSYGEPISTYAPNSTGAFAYQQLAQEILERNGAAIPQRVPS